MSLYHFMGAVEASYEARKDALDRLDCIAERRQEWHSEDLASLCRRRRRCAGNVRRARRAGAFARLASAVSAAIAREDADRAEY
jgi:hypothetical protein